MDDRTGAGGIVASKLVGAEVTRVLLDFNVTLECWRRDLTCYVTLESDSDLTSADGRTSRVSPGALAEAARPVAELHRAVINGVEIDADFVLHVFVDHGRSIAANPVDQYEAWSLTAGTERVVCLPGGDLAIWTGAEPAESQ